MSVYQSKPIAAIGSYEMVLPFQAVGIHSLVLNSENRNDFKNILENLAGQDYAVIFIQEDLFVDFSETVEAINDEYNTSVLPVPSPSGATGAGLASIRRSVEKAVGMDIFAER